MGTPDDALMPMVRAIVAGDHAAVSGLLATDPGLAKAKFEQGATRQTAKPYYIDEVGYIFAGDTALHIAAAAHQPGMVRRLLAACADVRARNRLGAEPLHAAATGSPGSGHWNPPAQAEAIACLV